MIAGAWRLRTRTLALGRPLIMGVVNVTPDSFSDGGDFFSEDAAVKHGLRLLEEGADILDIGGESTRPQGAIPVDAAEEMRRVLPVISALHASVQGAVISVDTVKAEVAEGAIERGAEIVNDVSALRLDPRMGEVCARAGVGVILMHSRGGVSDMGTYAHASYGADPVGEIVDEMETRVAVARAAGVEDDRIVVDPGFGFAKRSEHSIRLLAELERVTAREWPVAVGVSRKRFIGELSGAATPAERLEGTIAANVMALAAGARIFRVHDVRAHRRALDVAWEITRTRETGTER